MNSKRMIKYFSDPLWYINLSDKIKSYFINKPTDKQKLQEWYTIRNTFLKQIGILLDQKKIALAKNGINLDDKRKDIDTVVVHHAGKSSRDTTDPISFINAMHMFTLYLPVFLNKTHELYKTALWTNHFYNNQMTFIGYHYVIFKDGRSEQILQDEYIGWHCGNWEYNTRSVAICFIDDLENDQPTSKAIAEAKKIIKKYKPKEILGHREIKTTTICPGNLFLGKDGWKSKLL